MGRFDECPEREFGISLKHPFVDRVFRVRTHVTCQSAPMFVLDEGIPEFDPSLGSDGPERFGTGFCEADVDFGQGVLRWIRSRGVYNGAGTAGNSRLILLVVGHLDSDALWLEEQCFCQQKRWGDNDRKGEFELDQLGVDRRVRVLKVIYTS